MKSKITELVMSLEDHENRFHLFLEKHLVPINAVATILNGVYDQHDGVEKGGKKLASRAPPRRVPFAVISSAVVTPMKGCSQAENNS